MNNADRPMLNVCVDGWFVLLCFYLMTSDKTARVANLIHQFSDVESHITLTVCCSLSFQTFATDILCTSVLLKWLAVKSSLCTVYWYYLYDK